MTHLTGAFAQSVDSNQDLVAIQMAAINALPESQVETTGIKFVASTTIVMPGAAIDTEVNPLPPTLQNNSTSAEKLVHVYCPSQLACYWT